MLGTVFFALGMICIFLSVGLLAWRFGNNGPKFALIAALILAPAGAMGLLFDGMTFYAERGMHYFCQFPNGTQTAFINNPGYHIKWFGSIDPWKTTLSVLHSERSAGNTVTSLNPDISVRFNDAVNAQVGMATRFTLPTDQENFIKMALNYRTQENLVNSTLTKHVSEITANTARLFSAQEYVRGRGGDFLNAADDQMRNGAYLLDITESSVRKTEPATNENSELVRQIKGDDEQFKVVVRVRRNAETGEPVRKSSALDQYGIQVTQVMVEYVEPEQMFKDALGRQRNAAADASVKREEAKTLALEALRVNADGEVKKAEIRVEQEKEQIRIVTAAETEAKKQQAKQLEEVTKAKTLVLVEQEKLERENKALEIAKVKRDQALVQAEGIKALADAEAYKRERIMKADNALEKRLEAEVRIHAEYARALTNKNLVSQVSIGGGSNGPSGG